jgi:hypothetical protein
MYAWAAELSSSRFAATPKLYATGAAAAVLVAAQRPTIVPRSSVFQPTSPSAFDSFVRYWPESPPSGTNVWPDAAT